MCTGLEIIGAIGAASVVAGTAVAIDAAQNPPTPPKLPDPIKPPDPRSIDRAPGLRSAARRTQNQSTILGGYFGSDANASRPTLLGG